MFMDDVVIDGDLAEPIQIARSAGGQWLAGKFVSNQTVINLYATVSVARAKELEMIPEGDREQEFRAFWANQPIFMTRDNPQDGTGISDVILWNKTSYRVYFVADYSNRGYWKAIAARTSAS